MAPHVEDGYVPETPQNGGQTTANGHIAKEALNSSTEQGISNSQNETSEEFTPKAPLKLKGVLDQFKSFDVTPVIGKEFEDADLAEWLRAPNSDELLRDLAITSQHMNPLHLLSQLIECTRILSRFPSLPARRRLLPRPKRPERRSPERARSAPR